MSIRTATWHLCWAALFLGMTGCVFHGRRQIKHVWFDYNTLQSPALFIDEIDHLPLHAARVEQFRWQYGLGPNGPHGGFPGDAIPLPAGVLAPLSGIAPQGVRESAPTSPEPGAQRGETDGPPVPPAPPAASPSENAPRRPQKPDASRPQGLAPPSSRPSTDGPTALAAPRRRR